MVRSPIKSSSGDRVLKDRTLEGIAEYITSGKAKRIVVMTGAGISTSAGIPDFRSPETGLYANLARLELPYAEAVFAISFFEQNPVPFYTLAQELYPGTFRPTVTHSFVKLLHDKGLLLKLFTQNIDCLEREAGVPASAIVEAHGSFATQSCIRCRRPYPDADMKRHIEDKTIPHCMRNGCGGLVKPDIVFFGEQLPSSFFGTHDVPSRADLCIVLGTSLSVQPFASLPELCADRVPRLLVNMERVGSLGSRPEDVLYLGDCDQGVRRLAAACGWAKELERLWRQTQPDLPPAAADAPTTDPNERLNNELETLTRDIDQSLHLAKRHIDSVGQELNVRNASNLDHVFPHLKKPH